MVLGPRSSRVSGWEGSRRVWNRDELGFGQREGRREGIKRDYLGRRGLREAAYTAGEVSLHDQQLQVEIGWGLRSGRGLLFPTQEEAGGWKGELL